MSDRSTRTKGAIARFRRRLRGSSPSENTHPSAEALLGIIRSDAYLSHHYRHCYESLRALAPSNTTAPTIEIGAGPGIAKDHWPDIVRTDLETGPTVELTADATRLPFGDRTVGALVLKDALHHIPDVEAFLSEAHRVLEPGGVVAILDPYWGPLARLIYTWLHPEPFNSRTATWSFQARSPHDSNQALLYLLLRRDRAKFQHLFPDLHIEEHGAIIGPSFLLSGGLYGRTPVPSGLLIRLAQFESRRGRWLDPLRFGYLVTLRKKTT